MFRRIVLVLSGMIGGIVCVGLGGLGAVPVLNLPQDITGCPADMVRVGAVCLDKYEASVFPNADGSGAQLGVSTDDYPCDDDGNNCTNIFAVSQAGVAPSAFITWFQAQQACRNVGKKLVTNDDWQAAAAGTPDSTACNLSTDAVVNTGSLANCRSQWGAFDMVGNVWEWVADGGPRSTACGSWSGSSGDFQCLAGAATSGEPSALRRGGSFCDPTEAGVFAVNGFSGPSSDVDDVGFRCAR